MMHLILLLSVSKYQGLEAAYGLLCSINYYQSFVVSQGLFWFVAKVRHFLSSVFVLATVFVALCYTCH